MLNCIMSVLYNYEIILNFVGLCTRPSALVNWLIQLSSIPHLPVTQLFLCRHHRLDFVREKQWCAFITKKTPETLTSLTNILGRWQTVVVNLRRVFCKFAANSCRKFAESSGFVCNLASGKLFAANLRQV